MRARRDNKIFVYECAFDGESVHEANFVTAKLLEKRRRESFSVSCCCALCVCDGRRAGACFGGRLAFNGRTHTEREHSQFMSIIKIQRHDVGHYFESNLKSSC